MKKDVSLYIRFDPVLKEKIIEISVKERRRISDQVHVLIEEALNYRVKNEKPPVLVIKK